MIKVTTLRAATPGNRLYITNAKDVIHYACTIVKFPQHYLLQSHIDKVQYFIKHTYAKRLSIPASTLDVKITFSTNRPRQWLVEIKCSINLIDVSFTVEQHLVDNTKNATLNDITWWKVPCQT